MEVIVAEHSGFCFGVRRALKMADEATAKAGDVYSLGPLIHNRQVVQSLERRGLHVAHSVAEVPSGVTAMIRTHGAEPQAYENAARRGIQVIDATCPFVARVQQEAARFVDEGYQVFVLGEPDHPEARGIVAHAQGKAAIVEGPDDLAEVNLRPRVALVCQTTQRLESLRRLVEAILPHVQELRIANTICNATTNRQEASLTLADGVDMMIVIGGYNSANTTRLAQICADTGIATHHIETADEIDPRWLTGVTRVGVTAGASTPSEAIDAVVARLNELDGRVGSQAPLAS
jgi:4-hydroxy-3-methylbut-2-en-1-yl diphosphate reductase